MFTRFKHFGIMQDLREEAITYHQHALALQPHGQCCDHPLYAVSGIRSHVTVKRLHFDLRDILIVQLLNLACIVTTHLQLCGRLEDLEEAITYHRQALALRPHGIPFVQ